MRQTQDETIRGHAVSDRKGSGLMTKMIKVESCRDCPYCIVEKLHYEERMYCKSTKMDKSRELYEYRMPFPDWCPLEDVVK
jgi:hypothetical protein